MADEVSVCFPQDLCLCASPRWHIWVMEIVSIVAIVMIVNVFLFPRSSASAGMHDQFIICWRWWFSERRHARVDQTRSGWIRSRRSNIKTSSSSGLTLWPNERKLSKANKKVEDKKKIKKV